MTDLPTRALEAGLAAWPDVKLRKIAQAVGVSHPAILHHFKTTQDLKDAIAQHAINTGNERVLAIMSAMNHPLMR